MNLQVSHEWAERAAKVIPGGASTLSKGPAAFPDEYPKFLRSGLGTRVADVDGKIYTDWICGLGAMGLGYSHLQVENAIRGLMSEARYGSFSLPTPLEVEVAEALVDLIPCAEMVRFTKTGSEACAGAVRLARDFTKRSVIAVCGYHGWHDWYAASLAHHPGVPGELGPLVRTFEFNNLISLNDALSQDDVAAVIMEPVLHIAPDEEFLTSVRLRCDRYGSLLIFDENVTGFRVATQGAQAYYGVTPDLAVFGKAMSNGFPLAVIVGRRDIMQRAEYISGTFGGETVSLAAAKATIKVYKDTGCISRMHQLGNQFLGDVRAVLSADFTVDGLPWKPRISAADPRRLAGLCVGLAKRGHLIHPRGFYISCAHNYEDVKSFVRAAHGAQNDPWEHVAPAKGVSWLRS